MSAPIQSELPPEAEEAEEVPRSVGRALTPASTNESLKPLGLPKPGHQIALQWWLGGIGAYFLLSSVMIAALTESSGGLFATLQELLGIGAHVNPTLTVLVGGALLITLYSGWRSYRDIRLIRAEEVDIEWVEKHGREGLPLVFADAKIREELFKRGQREIPSEHTAVETLVDDRVRRVHFALSGDGNSRVSPVELQGIAEKRTLRYGSAARYCSSLLLLLAVLGTFAGVKTALPALISALTTSATNTSALVAPLTAVAGAFGGNALALVGAIALGLIAQGFTTARRHLLERLDMVSSEHIYRSDIQSETNPLQAAILALRDTAREMREATGRMSGIDSGLQGLDRAFRTSFDTLSDRLTDLAAQNESVLHNRTHGALEALRVQVSQLAQATDANARVYAGLAESVSSRTTESRKAIELMTVSNDQLRAAMESFVRIADQATTSAQRMEQASDTVAEQSRHATVQIGASSAAVATAVTQLQPALDQMGTAVEKVARIATESDKRVADTLADMGDKVARLAQSLAAAEQAQTRQRDSERAIAGRGAAEPGGADVVSLLRRIASSVERRTSWVSATAVAAGPLLGVLGGAALAYFVLKSR